MRAKSTGLFFLFFLDFLYLGLISAGFPGLGVTVPQSALSPARWGL